MIEQQIMNQLKALHEKQYGLHTNNIRYFFAPGRVNLIGEHTDYNGGSVFPCAINLGTYASVTIRNDNLIRVYSQNFADAGIIEFQLNNLIYEDKHGWANYPKGMIKAFFDNNYILSHGLDICITANLPTGTGLSSSASLEVLIGFIINSIFNFYIDNISIAKFGQKAENNFIKVNCGIMDQFAIAMGRENSAILLDCNTLAYEYANIHLTDHKIVIGNTKKPRTLADSKYNERFNECREALANLQQQLPINALGQLDLIKFDKHKNLINNAVIQKRARHAVSENIRTKDAVKALNAGDIILFGNLMNQSHVSLRDDYEVTGTELDTMVEAAWQHPGCVGARMTGAGFGGCTINIVKNDSIDDFINSVSNSYTQKTGITPEFYPVKVSGGVRELII